MFRILLSSGDSEIAKIVIDESIVGGEEARKFLEEVRCTFPQVCACRNCRMIILCCCMLY